MTLRGILLPVAHQCRTNTKPPPEAGRSICETGSRILQDRYQITVASKGWFLVYLPYAVIFVGSCLYHAFRAKWLVHRETTKQIAIAHLESLLRQGDIMQGEFTNLTDAKDYWTRQVNVWREITTNVIVNNWTECFKV